MHAQKVIGQMNRSMSTSQQQNLGTKINTTHVENKIKQVSIT